LRSCSISAGAASRPSRWVSSSARRPADTGFSPDGGSRDDCWACPYQWFLTGSRSNAVRNQPRMPIHTRRSPLARTGHATRPRWRDRYRVTINSRSPTRRSTRTAVPSPLR
jgi:hypothetical protein